MNRRVPDGLVFALYALPIFFFPLSTAGASISLALFGVVYLASGYWRRWRVLWQRPCAPPLALLRKRVIFVYSTHHIETPKYFWRNRGKKWAKTARKFTGDKRKLKAALAAKVSLTDLRVGDLVFFASDPGDHRTIYHVGLSIGGGQMIEAPYTGENVRISSIWRSSLFGAARP